MVSSIFSLDTVMDQATFDAQLVTSTLDLLNNSPSFGSTTFAPMDRQTFGAQVVSTTLDYLNSDPYGGLGSSNDYAFQTAVLGAVYTGKGTIVDMIG